MENKNASMAIQMFCNTDRMHRKLYEAELSDIGVHRSQHKILMFLAENKNYSPSQKEIAEKFNISPAAVAVTLKKLEASGYIKKTVFHKDNRINNVAITEKAMEVVEKTRECSKEIEKIIFSDFSENEIAQFCGFLGKMQSSIEKYLSEKQ